MRRLEKNGSSILIVNHRIVELVRIANRATVLHDGVDVGCLECKRSAKRASSR
jgi:ribose transport system ATP-binding protein